MIPTQDIRRMADAYTRWLTQILLNNSFQFSALLERIKLKGLPAIEKPEKSQGSELLVTNLLLYNQLLLAEADKDSTPCLLFIHDSGRTYVMLDYRQGYWCISSGSTNNLNTYLPNDVSLTVGGNISKERAYREALTTFHDLYFKLAIS
jgi:hypothetical protein